MAQNSLLPVSWLCPFLCCCSVEARSSLVPGTLSSVSFNVLLCHGLAMWVSTWHAFTAMFSASDTITFHSAVAQMDLPLPCQLFCFYCCNHPLWAFATISESVQRWSTGYFRPATSKTSWMAFTPANWLNSLSA